MRINKNKVLILLAELAIILITTAMIKGYYDMPYMEVFLKLSKIGTLICILYTCFLCAIQKKIFNIINLVFISFWVFQFGLPICYAFIPNYNNFYINLFNTNILVNAAIYSILSIQVFGFSLCLFYSNGEKKNKTIFNNASWNNDPSFVASLALVLFIITALVQLPLVIYAAYKTVAVGFFEAGTRTFLVSNALYRATQAFCVPAAFLCIIFSVNIKRRNFIKMIVVLICVMQLIAGDRASGLAGLLAVIYYQIFGETNKSNIESNTVKKQEKVASLKKQVVFGMVLCILLVILVYVAKARVATEKIVLIELIRKSIFKSFFAELGLNFTTICFIMDYVPTTSPFRCGSSYLEAVICLIPKSLDMTGTIENILTPEMWLHYTNHEVYGGLLDFGMGFSVIGESYMNFGWGGWIAIFILGSLVMRFINGEFSNMSRWQKYINVVLLISLMTFARRGFYDLLKDIEYSILCIGLMLSVSYKIIRRNY